MGTDSFRFSGCGEKQKKVAGDWSGSCLPQLSGPILSDTLGEKIQEIFERICGVAVNMDFVVEMRAGGNPATAHIADYITPAHFLAGRDNQL